jgi:deoxyribodipyrimidine photolyase-related protein
MSNSISILFPHQLFKNNPVLHNKTEVYLVEEALFFNQYQFHKQKLVLHRASMKFYEQYLKKEGFKVHYIESSDKLTDSKKLIDDLAKKRVKEINIIEVVDNWLMKKIKVACNEHNIILNITESPNFLNTNNSVASFFNNRKTYFQTDFYTWQRKQRSILLEKDGKPVGGKWTYDAENRSKFPKKEIVPHLPLPKENEFIQEAKTYVQKHFPNNYGDANGPNLFVTNFKDAENWLDEFLNTRFEKFGIY